MEEGVREDENAEEEGEGEAGSTEVEGEGCKEPGCSDNGVGLRVRSCFPLFVHGW